MKKNIYYVLVLAFLLRLIASNQSLWLDEATSALVARDYSWNEIINQFLPSDFHPPLYYFVLKIWSSVFGTSELGLRSLSIFLGTLTVYGVYLIGNKIKGNAVGNMAALLLATSSLHIYYSHEARMYVMSTALVTFAVYYFLKLQKKETKKDWIVFSCLLALIYLTDYLPLLIFPVFLIPVIKKKRKTIRKFILSCIPLFVAIGLTLPIFISQFKGGTNVSTSAPMWWSILGKTTLKNVLLIPTKFILGRISFYSKAVYFFMTLFSVGLFSYLVIQAKKIKNTKIIFYWLIIPVSLSIILGFFIPVVSYFRLLFALPPLYILVALALDKIPENKFLPLFVLVLAVQFTGSYFYLSQTRFQREDWRGLVRFINSESKDKRTQVLFVKNSQMEAYRYYDKDSNLIAYPEKIDWEAEQIWLMRYVQPIFDPDDKVRENVEKQGFHKESEHSFNGVVVWKYTKSI
jgi:4-amino-4-deoxy-L-arabinose transferase-like glycosyltransferase